MIKLTRESLRQMITEELGLGRKTETNTVKVTSNQLRNIILKEVQKISEQDLVFGEDPEDTEQLKTRSVEDVLSAGEPFKGEPGDPYGYAVDDEGVYVISKGAKRRKNAIRLDPRTKNGAIAIRKLARANRKNPDIIALIRDENDFLQVASRTLGKEPKPEKAMQLIAQIEQGLGKALNQMSAKEMVANNVVMKAITDALKDPGFAKEVDVDFGVEEPTEQDLEMLLPKLRKKQK